MSTVGIIAEFNPFHKGHEYIIAKAKEVTGADNVVIVMSGDFVQRGAPAVCDKYTRTMMALDGGADAVFEIPVPFATGSAEIFAEGAVKLLLTMGCVDYICFGSECGDIEILYELADMIIAESEAFKTKLKENLRMGLSYPEARERAVSEASSNRGEQSGIINNDKSGTHNAIADGDKASLAEEGKNDQDILHRKLLSDVLRNPNNILGIEYCKALRRLAANGVSEEELPKLVTIKREGMSYSDKELEEGKFASATGLRRLICGYDNYQPSFNELIKYTTDCAAVCIADGFNVTLPITEDDFSDMLGIGLAMNYESFAPREKDTPDGQTDSPAEGEKVPVIEDLSMGLYNRLGKYIGRPMKFSELVMALKTKNVTYTAVSRALLHILLGTKAELVQKMKASTYLPYIRLLGFKKESSKLLKNIGEEGHAPLINKLADADTADELLAHDIFAASCYNQVVYSKFDTRLKNEYEAGVVIR